MKNFLATIYRMFKDKSCRTEVLKSIFTERNILTYAWMMMLLLFGAPFWVVFIAVTFLPMLFNKDNKQL